VADIGWARYFSGAERELPLTVGCMPATKNVVRLARMARERAAQRRGSAQYCRMFVYLPKEIALEIENERRRYLEVPSRSKVMTALFSEALAMRASLRSRIERKRAEPWRGLDAQSPPPPKRGRREERIHRRLDRE
jgi:hypothetical protein